MTLEITPELEEIRAKADALGIKYHHRAGIAKIQELIDAHESAGTVDVAGEEGTEDVVVPSRVVPMTSEEYRKGANEDARRKANRLIRCRIQCMNPSKREWEGEIISVGSSKLGTFKKFIPFDGREWHVPQIIFDHLKERKCSVFYNERDPHNPRQTVRKARLVDEFAIEVLPPLSRKELDELKKQQAVAGA